MSSRKPWVLGYLPCLFLVLKEEGMPKMVTVEVAGVRMLYPTSLICLTLEEDVVCQKGGDSKSRNDSPMIPDELKGGKSTF